jgi:iron complex outermembrane receptor protein
LDRKIILMGASALVIAAAGAPAFAQTARAAATAASNAQTTVIEEITVTARKKEESLQDVPIAVTAATSEELQRVRIDEPNDLARLAPSLQVSATAGGGATAMSVTMRGQRAADLLLTISQPVGIYQDSVNVPHPVGTNNSFFDLERVEVLKGPQGTLYGRNTTGGAINILTRNPDFSGMHGFVEGELSKYDGRRIGGAINIPLMGEILALRVAAQHWDRDGYSESIITGQKSGSDRDDDLVRASLLFVPNEQFTAVAKYEYGNFKRNGLPYTVVFRTPVAAALTNPEVNNAAGAAGLALLNQCTNSLQFSNCSGQLQKDDVKTHHAVFDASWSPSGALTIRSITGYHYFRNTRIFDLDALPWTIGENGFGTDGGVQPFIGISTPPAGARLPNGALAPTGPFTIPVPLEPDQQSGQFTQEFNASGEFGRISWLVGAFYSNDKGKGSQVTVRTPATAIRTAPFFAPSANSFEGLDVDSKTYAIFTQNDISITDQLSLTVGLRYTEEKLSQNNASWAYNQNFNTAQPPTLSGPGRNFQCTFGPLAASAAGDAFGGPRPAVFQADREACAVQQKAKFDGTSYLASLNYKLTENQLVYAKISRGFRGGALQLRAPYVAPAEPEQADDYELGFKGDFWNRRLRFNAAIYRTDYDNQQQTGIEFVPGTSNPAVPGSGVRTTVLRNAAKARYQGAEIEWRVLPFEGFSFYGNLGVLDAEYRKWPNAPRALGNPAPATLDAAGLQIEIPKYTGNVGARYEFDAGPGRLGVQADVNFFTKTPFTALTDEVLVPDSYEKFYRKGRQLVSARIDYAIPDHGLTVALWATNLTNEHYQAASIVSTANGGLVTGFTREPRMYGITLRKSFGAE